MSTAIVPGNGNAISAGVLEKVLLQGDLGSLNSQQRIEYMTRVCDSLGLNPLTKPFEFLTFQGKMVMYARRDCTEQLRKLHAVSVTIAAREVTEGCYIVTARAQDRHGRHDESIGAVNIEGLKGENRSNAMMKAETKAKRRVTLSICGLGMLDESETDSIPGARVAEYTPPALKEEAKATAPKGETAATKGGATGAGTAVSRPAGVTMQTQTSTKTWTTATTGATSTKPPRADQIRHDGNLATAEQVKALHTLKAKLQIGDCDGSCAKEVPKFKKSAGVTVPVTVYCIYHTQLAAFKDEDGKPCRSSKDLSRTQISYLLDRYQARINSQDQRAEQPVDVAAILPLVTDPPKPSLGQLVDKHFPVGQEDDFSAWLHGHWGKDHVQELDRDEAETALALLLAMGTDSEDETLAKARAMGKVR